MNQAVLLQGLPGSSSYPTSPILVEGYGRVSPGEIADRIRPIHVDKGRENPVYSQQVPRGGQVHIIVEMLKIDSCPYVETWWEIPEATIYARSGSQNHLEHI